MGEQLHITVMEGGPSAEREVSLRTGVAVRRALRANGHKVSVLDPIGDKWQLPLGTDGVFLALHGTYGEDGQVQARLDALGVPYTGSSAESSAVAFDKAETKHRLERAGVTTPAWIEVKSNNVTRPDWLQMPLVLKPVCDWNRLFWMSAWCILVTLESLLLKQAVWGFGCPGRKVQSFLSRAAELRTQGPTTVPAPVPPVLPQPQDR